MIASPDFFIQEKKDDFREGMKMSLLVGVLSGGVIALIRHFQGKGFDGFASSLIVATFLLLWWAWALRKEATTRRIWAQIGLLVATLAITGSSMLFFLQYYFPVKK